MDKTPVYVQDIEAAQKWFYGKFGTAANGAIRMTLADLIWFLQNRPDLAAPTQGDENGKSKP